MAHVFLSYARADRARAEAVKTALERAGLTVFFDVDGLDGGDVFPDVLDREVKGAGAVVSLWSPHSLSRPWVKQECSICLKRKCLIPLMIEPLGELDVPVAFEGLQQIDFTGFHGRTDTDEWTKLMRSLARTLGRPELAPVPRAEKPKARPAAQSAKGSRPGRMLWVIFLVAAALTVGVIAARQLLSTNEISRLEDPAAETPAKSAETADSLPDAAPADLVPAGPALVEAAPGTACGDLKAQVYFDFDKTTPNLASVVVLEDALARSFECDLIEVRIEAHDDLFNSPPYAQAVSERRAGSVAELLTARGVDRMIVTSIGYGSSQPLVAGERNPANRRADVFFDYEPPGVVP